MEIYRNIPGRPAAGRQGLFRKKNTKNNCRQVPGTGRPTAGGRLALAARLPGGRLSLPYIRVGWSPHPSFVSLQFFCLLTFHFCNPLLNLFLVFLALLLHLFFMQYSLPPLCSPPYLMLHVVLILLRLLGV